MKGIPKKIVDEKCIKIYQEYFGQIFGKIPDKIPGVMSGYILEKLTSFSNVYEILMKLLEDTLDNFLEKIQGKFLKKTTNNEE